MREQNRKWEVGDLVTREGLTGREQLGAIWRLSVPAIMAQLASILMQYIDAAMVGSLGADASASIGLVASSTWLLGGLCGNLSSGFSVQVAQYIGAGQHAQARRTVKQALPVGLLFSLMLCTVGVGISPWLPDWLGGQESIRQDASRYFCIYACAIPFYQVNSLSCAILQCSGNIRIPSLLNAAMCGLDVLFNFLFIFPTRILSLGPVTLAVPGLNMGVAGAALGTATAEAVTGLAALFLLCAKHKTLRLCREDSWRISRACLRRAVTISTPLAVEHVALCGAMVATTRIVSPLGAVALSANSFAVTAESLCYMPGYGIGATATALVGQSIGAGKSTLAKRYAWMTVALGMSVMALCGALMYAAAPVVFEMLTPEVAIRELGIRVLRIEILAEPLFGASIVASGALCGAGDTLIPSLLNLGSIWGVRITLSLLLVGPLGLAGVWIAMCAELCFRGTIFLIRLKCGKWFLASV